MAAASFNVAPGESTDATTARRKIAMALMMQGADTSPVRHWTQGAARALQGALGGYELYREDQKDEKEKADARGMYSDFVKALYPQAGGAADTAPATPTAPRGVPMASTSGKVYQNDEPSPLDPPSGADRDMAIRTVIAEAGNQGPVGQQAVANVIRNRAVSGNFGGDTVSGVIQKPYQFEPWNTEAGRGRMAAIDPNSPQYQSADQALTRAYAGEDPTRGATHFYAPKAQAALGRQAPSWDNGRGVNIGDHRFFGGAGTPSVLAGASPDAVSSQSRAPAQPVPNAPAQPSLAPMLPGMLNNKYTSPIAQAIIQKQFEQQFGQNPYDFKVAGDTLYRVNPKTGAVERAGEASKGQFTKIGVDPRTGEDIMGFVDPGTGKVTPYQGVQQPQAAPQASPQTNPAVPSSGVLPQQDAATPPPPPPGVDAKTWRKTLAEEGAKKAVSQPERNKQAKAVANIVVDDIDRSLATMDKAIIPTTGAIGNAASYVPGTAAHDVSKLVDTVKANAGFAELQKMRDNSPTGGALGNVSEKEIAFLQATIGNLQQSQNEQQFRDNLKRVKNVYLDIIHGEGNGPARERLSYKEKANPKIDALLQKYGG